jgi:hypothetical protein
VFLSISLSKFDIHVVIHLIFHKILLSAKEYRKSLSAQEKRLPLGQLVKPSIRLYPDKSCWKK